MRKGVAKVTVRHSRLSRTSSYGMILLGLLAFLFVQPGLGIILMIIGFVMLWFYRRQMRSPTEASEPRFDKGAAN